MTDQTPAGLEIGVMSVDAFDAMRELSVVAFGDDPHIRELLVLSPIGVRRDLQNVSDGDASSGRSPARPPQPLAPAPMGLRPVTRGEMGGAGCAGPAAAAGFTLKDAPRFAVRRPVGPNSHRGALLSGSVSARSGHWTLTTGGSGPFTRPVRRRRCCALKRRGRSWHSDRTAHLVRR